MQHRGTSTDADRRHAAMAAQPAAMGAHPAAMGAHPAAMGAHSAATASASRRSAAGAGTHPRPHGRRSPIDTPSPVDGESGSLVTEYGLLAVVAATVAGVVIQWASGGALVTLFNALLRHARSLVGA